MEHVAEPLLFSSHRLAEEEEEEEEELQMKLKSRPLQEVLLVEKKQESYQVALKRLSFAVSRFLHLQKEKQMKR